MMAASCLFISLVALIHMREKEWNGRESPCEVKTGRKGVVLFVGAFCVRRALVFGSQQRNCLLKRLLLKSCKNALFKQKTKTTNGARKMPKSGRRHGTTPSAEFGDFNASCILLAHSISFHDFFCSPEFSDKSRHQKIPPQFSFFLHTERPLLRGGGGGESI